MGIIADRFAAQIQQMKARHEAESVKTRAMINEAHVLLDEMKRIDEEITRILA